MDGIICRQYFSLILLFGLHIGDAGYLRMQAPSKLKDYCSDDIVQSDAEVLGCFKPRLHYLSVV